MRAAAALDGKLARGRVTVFLGAILVADIPLMIQVSRDAATMPGEPAPAAVSARPYRKVFASYSHRDAAIVEQFERYAEAIGDEYLRDCRRLRSGDPWNQKLLEMIDEADVFQLFWSRNSMESPHVRQEWEHALKRKREGFIRPVWWEDTFPQRLPELPPPDLACLHFQRIGGGFGSHVPLAAAGSVREPACDRPDLDRASSAGIPRTPMTPLERLDGEPRESAAGMAVRADENDCERALSDEEDGSARPWASPAPEMPLASGGTEVSDDDLTGTAWSDCYVLLKCIAIGTGLALLLLFFAWVCGML
jgi:hypothetical protein